MRSCAYDRSAGGGAGEQVYTIAVVTRGAMSKNAFSLANQPVSRGLKDEDPAVKIKKVSSKDRKIENEGEKLTGGDSGPSYSFTGVTPGSKSTNNATTTYHHKMLQIVFRDLHAPSY